MPKSPISKSIQSPAKTWNRSFAAPTPRPRRWCRRPRTTTMECSDMMRFIGPANARRDALLVAAVVAVSGISDAAAQAPYYAGKQIRMVIASGAGGGYDVYARFLARHLPRHIPGNPTIVSQNMPAASGLAATNWTYTAAPKDGSVILATYNALLDDPLYGS